MSAPKSGAEGDAVAQGCIAYAASQEEVEGLCQSILASGTLALGFDIEWHVTYRHASASINTILGSFSRSVCDER